MNEFGLIALRIPGECPQKFKKILNQEFYLFDNRYKIVKTKKIPIIKKEVDTTLLNDNHIHIGAVVGKNGSGKSSIIDIIYRIMNNVSAVLESKMGMEQLIFIDGLYGELFYNIGEVEYRVSCLNKVVSLSQILDAKITELFKFEISETGINVKCGDICQARSYLEQLFYSIGTNYSVQSYLPSSYIEEIGYRVKAKSSNLMPDGDIWIKDVFNKNDGYVSPIVLNPYRRPDGVIDMENELELTIDRLISILYYYSKSNTQFLPEYKLSKIEFQLDEHSLDGKLNRDSFVTFDVCFFKKDIKLENAIARIIISQYPITQPDDGQYHPDEYYMALAYLVYKTLSIASKYQNYSKYRQLTDKNYYDKADEEDIKLIEGLVQQICADSSHITNKIKQTLQYLKIKGCAFQDSVSIENYYKILHSSLSDIKEKEELKEIMEGKSDNINAITRNLPPPIFKPTITFAKTSDSTETTLSKMSSGERQMICTMSTIIYHILNLQSVECDKNRVNYKNINIIFDEIEICFHPEYQREFVNRLIGALKILNKGVGSAKYNFNVLIATHSPFILSDITSLFTLYLDNGEIVGKNNTIGNPFGANVNDILRHSFFLDKGFGGEYSKKVITEVIKNLSRRKKLNNKESIKCFIREIVGDGLVKECLKMLYFKKFNEKI